MKDRVKFGIEHTHFIKGIGIILMFTHHVVIPSKTGYPYDLLSSDPQTVIFAVTKVCVTLFTLLSGYGLTKSFEKKNVSAVGFSIRHIIKLLINYWWVYIPVFILEQSGIVRPFPYKPLTYYINGSFPPIVNFSLDLFGFAAFFDSVTINGSWWYIEAIIFCYLLFPLFLSAVKKNPAAALALSAMPNIIISVFINRVSFSTDRELFYFFPFIVGIFMAEKNIPDKMAELAQNRFLPCLCVSSVLLLPSGILAAWLPHIIFTFMSVDIVFLSILFLRYETFVSRWIKSFGKYSMNMYLIHLFPRYYWLIISWIFFLNTSIPAQTAFLLLICFVFSYFLEKIKHRVNTVITKAKNKKL